jgi:hypothetical protein
MQFIAAYYPVAAPRSFDAMKFGVKNKVSFVLVRRILYRCITQASELPIWFSSHAVALLSERDG